MDNERSLISALFFKLFFSAVLCVFCSVSLSAQTATADASIFVVNGATNPPTVMQAWQSTPVQFMVEDVFFSKTLGRYLGQTVDESFAVTANLLSGNTVVYQEGVGLVKFSHGYFSFILGQKNTLMPSVLAVPNMVLQLVLPSQTATFAVTALPYTIHARVAEVGLAGLASAVSGNFVSTFSVQTGLVVTNNKLVVRGSRVGLGTFSPAYTLDVAGVANFSDMYLNGRPLSETLSWRQNSVNTANIYTLKPQIGIRTAFPGAGFSLHVAATINATNLTRNGNPISASNFWVSTIVPTYNLYILDHNVAIGSAVPKALVDVNGAVRMDTTSSGNPGTLRWAAVDAIKDFQGYVDTLENGVPTQTWRSLTGIRGSGRADRVTRWLGAVSPPNLDYVQDLIHKSGVGLGVGISPASRLQVAGKSLDTGPVFLVSSSANMPLIHISPTGGVGIGTTLAGNRLEVVGTINAQDLLINGIPLRLTLSNGTYWLRNEKNSLYYLHGNVGIGRPDPESLFEIAAPNHAPGEPTKNPAMTFTAKVGQADQQQYTLGINAQEDGVFRVEKGATLGSETPLFVALDDRFGVGLANPRANLHVSGNTGLILTGLYEAISLGVNAITSTVSVTGPGTRMIYHPSKSIFRVGYLSGTDLYQGTQWNNDSMGIDTTAFGRDHLVSGNRSHAIGGDAHRVGGAYALVVGGQGNQAYGDFSVGLGRGAGANRHGAFVWGDGVGGSFSAVTENQFLIRAAGGVGINTSQTGLYVQFSTKNVSLTVYPKPVGAVHFLGILPDPTDWGSSQSIVDALKTQGYLLSSGEMAPSFNASAVLSFPPGFAYSDLEAQIREVLSLHSQGLVFDFKGRNSKSFVYTQQGGVGVNTLTPAANSLSVLNPVFINATGNAGLFVKSTSKNEPTFLTVGTENPTTSPSFVVDASGNVGVGKFPDLLANGSPVSGSVPVYGYLESSGAIVANEFTFPDGQGLSASASVIVWGFRDTTPNIYFPSANMTANGRLTKAGNVGIGTTSPNSLLEISNRSSLLGFTGAVSPVITFDLDGTDRYTMGVSKNDTDVFRIGVGGATDLGTGSPFAVLNNRVGIAITRPLNSALSVGGTTLVDRLTVGTANLGATTNLAVRSVNSTQFIVNGELIGWLSVARDNGTTDVFHDTAYSPNTIPPIYSFVGIGTTVPLYALDVAGTLNILATTPETPSIFMQNFIIDGDYYADQLNLRDDFTGSAPSLLVTNEDLILDPHTGTVNINISKVFTRGEGAGGYVGMWSTDEGVPSFSVFAQTNMYWTSPTDTSAGVLLVTANTTVSKYKAYSDSFSASNNVNLGSSELDVMLTAKSVISHNGLLANSRSHNAVSMNVLIQSWPEEGVDWVTYPDSPIPLTGLRIHMATIPSGNTVSYFSGGAKAVGLNVDMSGVALQQFTDEGYRFPALFVGSDTLVGIGGTPNAALDVYGTLRAQTFHISDGLAISTINVLNAIYIDQPGRVGFGTNFPTNALDLAGSIQSIGMVAPVSAKNLSAGGGNLTVGTNGYVGIGTSTPVAQWELQKQFNALPSSDFTFQIVDATVTDNLVTKPLLGIKVVLSTVSGNNYANKLGDLFNVKKVVATGYKLDLSGLNVPTGGVVVGMSSVVSTNRDADRKAAIFMGGNVGIGTTVPAYPLEVVGTLFATNAPAANFLTEQEVASFNMLNIANSIVIKKQAQFWDLSVSTLNQKELRLLGTLSIPSQRLVVNNHLLVQTLVSINETVTANSVISGTSALQSVSVNKMAVGGALSSDALRVYGDLVATQLSVNTGNLQSSGFSVNGTSLFLTDTGRLGIGTSSPGSSKIHIKTEPYQVGGTVAVMDPADYRTWNPMILQNAVATSGDAVGVVFLPDYDTSGHSGSGIVAIKTSDTVTSSALAFITDPQGEAAYPQERLRITDSGWVGIGTTAPETLLHVNGTFAATNLTLPTGSLTLNAMSGSTVTFSITTNIAALVEIDRLRLSSVGFVPTTAPVIASGNGKLFVDAATQQLFYAVKKNGDDILGNLSVTTSVVPDVLPYFDDGRSMAGASLMKWVTENNVGVLRISSVNEAAYVSGSRFLVAGLVSQNNLESRVLHQINLGFKDRSTPGTGRFSGMDVLLDGAVSFHQDDRLIGLHVDVANTLRTQTTLPGGGVVAGTVAAAAFLVGTESSGNMSISSGAEAERDITPSASLHILAKKTNHVPLWVQTTVNSVLVNSLFVSPNTDVGIGTSLPSARLSVRAQNSTDASLRLANSSGASVFAVTDSGVGIGVSQPSAALSVLGLVSANGTAFGGLLGGTLAVNTPNSGLTVSSLGEVMIGTTAPLGQFTMRRQFTSPAAVPNDFLMQDILQTIGSGNVAVAVSRNITGVGVVVSTDAFSTFEGTSGSKLATGMDLNLKNLVAITGNPVVGIYADAGLLATTMGAGRYAATFMGGNIGVGVTQPTVMVDVLGDIRVRNLIASGNWTLSSVTTDILSGIDATVTTFDIRSTTPLSLEVTKELWVGAAATVNIEGGTYDTNIFRTVALNALFGTANRVFVGYDTADIDVFNYETQIAIDFPSNPALGVKGSGRLDALTVPTVNVGTSILAGTLSINSPLSITANRVNQSGSVSMLTLRMFPTANVSGVALFVQNISPASPLVFRPSANATATIDMSSVSAGLPTRVVGYSSLGRISDTPFLRYTETQASGGTYSVLSVGTVNATLTSGNEVMGLYSGYGTTAGLGNVYASRVSVGMGPRVTGTGAVFTGMSVGQLSAQNVGGGEVFGGLYVDMHDSLKVSTVFPNPETPDALGTKIAAIFRAGSQTSGNVGIHTDESLSGSFWPSADLHVVSVTPNPIWVQTATRTGIGSDSSGQLSIGHVVPSANLSVVGYSDTQALSVMAGSTQVMVAGSAGIGVGQLPNGAAWSVAGTVSANRITMTGLQSSSLQVGNSVAVNSAGYVGIGTLTPDAPLTMAKLFALPADLASDYRQRVVSVDINTGANTYGPVTGYDVLIDTDSSSQFGTGTTPVEAIGMLVNLKNLQSTVNGVVQGVYADVSGATGTRYGAVFMGGNVGIGTTVPSTALQVGGTITAVNAINIARVSINATAAAFNSLAVPSGTLYGANFVNMSVATSGVDVVVLDTLRFANTSGVTVNFQDNLSANKVWTSDGIVAGVATFNAMFIPEKPSGWVIPPALWVSENALFHNNLTLSPLLDSNLYVGSLIATQNGFFPPIQVATGVSVNVKGKLGVSAAYLNIISPASVQTDAAWGSSLVLRDVGPSGTTTTIPHYQYGTRIIWLGNMFKNYVGVPTTLNMAMYGMELISGTASGIITSNTTLALRPNTTSGNHIGMVASMNTDSEYALRVVASLNTTVLTSDYNANQVTMLFGDRTTAGSSKFIGTDVFLSGKSPLAETVVGVSVNLTQLKSESSTQLPINEDFAVDGFKSSAVFLAENNGDTQGTVGVFTFDNNNLNGYATPNATLHVGNTATGNAGPFLIGTTATANTFIVTSLNAGIWVASADAQLRTTGLLVHATGTNAFKTNTAAGTPILTALQTGSVGIGTTQAIASLNVVHGATTGYAFWMDNPSASNPFVMTGAGNVGLGNITPTATLGIMFDKSKYTFDVPVEWQIVEIHDDGCAVNSGRPEVIGRYSIGGVNYTAAIVKSPDTQCLSLATYSAGQIVDAAALGLSNYPAVSAGFSPLRVNSTAGVALSMGQTGKIGIWRASPTENYMSMAVSGSVMAGDTTAVALPWLLTEAPSIYPAGYGYAVSQAGDFAFLGHYRESSSVSGNGVLMWGKDAGDVLSFKDLSQTELLHFVKASGGGPRMGVATSDPKATLSIGATAITQYPFRLDSSAISNILLVDTAGNVGLGTGVPSKNLHVLGNFNIGALDIGGLNAGTVTTNYMSLGKLGFGVLYETAPEFKSTLPIHHVGMTLGVYSSANITGMSYRLTSGNAYTSALVNANTAAVKVIGLNVDVTNLATQEYSGNSDGYKASAVFMGGTVLVGHRKISGVTTISTANIPLEVYAMDLDGKSTSTGNMLQIEARDNTNAPLNIFLNYMGNQDLFHEVSPLAFTAIRDIDDEESAAIADLLVNSSPRRLDVQATRNVSRFSLGNITDVPYSSLPKSYVNTGALDYTYAGYQQSVLDIMNQSKTKATAVLHVQRATDQGSGNQDSMIQILSGQSASTVTKSMVSTVGVGYVGFGLSSSNVDLAAIDRPLVVSGDVQVGVTRNSFFLGTADWGDKVYFSGGRIYAPGGNSDNTHAYFMGRYNVSSTLSELRLNIGETSTTSPNPSSKLIIDSYPTASASIATNLNNWGASGSLATGFSVSVFGYVDPSDATVKVELPVHAGVGIGTTSPAAGLHVVSRSLPDYPRATPTANTVLIVSSGNHNLALVNYGTATDANLMTFIHKKTAVDGDTLSILGSIEIDGFGGVQFASPEADYAEYLPKISGETLRPGDVVGIVNGKVSRATVGARSVKVMSSRPIVSGNFPGNDQLDAFGLVAFMGQVPVRVRGPVRAGDYLIPSGLQDGTAVAIVASSVVKPEQIIGQSWTSSDKEGESTVTAVVGLSFANKHVGERLGAVVSLRDEVSAIQSDMEKLKAYLQTKYEEREAKIALLKKR